MSLRSYFRRSQSVQKKLRANHGRATRRPRFETFEDRRMLSFTPAVNYATVGTPSAIVTADFNNDGNLDLATCANASIGSFSVLMGDGAGGFGAAQRTVIGSQLSSMAVADFNNDTRPDMVVSDSGSFRILVGNGDGTFQAGVSAGYGDMAAVGDFNSDGNIDVVVNWLDGDWWTHIQVYRGNGQGGFAVGPDSYYSGWGGMTAVDLNNDGKLDVATGEGLAFLGDGTGGLQFDWNQQVLLNGGAVATGNFTGDGNADVIVASDTQLAVLRGRGDGGFHAPIHYSVNGIPHSAVATADFNADGQLDAVVTDKNAATVSVMLGNGDGTLHFGGTFATGAAPSDVLVGDFNRDGRPDVAVSNAAADARTVSILLNDGVWQAEPNLIGDYNLDQSVDAADYIVWRMTLGNDVARFSGADGSGNGVVDQDDYDVWRAHFGQTIAAGVESRMQGGKAEGEGNVESPQPLADSRPLLATATLRPQGEMVVCALTEPAARDERPVLRATHRPDFGELSRAAPPAMLASLAPRPKSGTVYASSVTVAARRDDALVAWLAAQREPAEPFDNLGAIQPREYDGPSRADGVTIDFVDECFALLADDGAAN